MIPIRVIDSWNPNYLHIKKKIARFRAPTYPQSPNRVCFEKVAHSKDDMMNFKGCRGTVILISAALICLAPEIGSAYEEGTAALEAPIASTASKGQVATEAPESQISTIAASEAQVTSVTSSEAQITSVEEVSTGNYSRFPFRVSVSVRGGYDDNVNTSKINKQDSTFTNGSAAITYDFGSPRTQLSLQTGGGVTYYWDHLRNIGINNNDYDFNVYLGLQVVHKLSPRLTWTSNDYLTYQTEPDFTLAVGLNRRSGNFFYTQDKSTIAYLWTPRFSTATSSTFVAVRYDDSGVGFFEDRIESTVGNEFRFLLWPTTTLVAEGRVQFVSYSHDGDQTGPPILLANGSTFVPRFRRDSMTYFALGGFDHAFSSRLSASVRGGAEFREYDNSLEASDQSAPYFEGTLNYAVGKNTSVSWTNRYAIEEPDVQLNPSRTTFRTGLRAKHDFTARISGNVGAYYEHDDYDSVNSFTVISPAFTEEAFDAAVSLRFAVTRYLGIEAGFNHTEVWSDIFLREYSRNRYWGGVNFLF